MIAITKAALVSIAAIVSVFGAACGGDADTSKADASSTFCAAYARVDDAVDSATDETAVAAAIAAHADDLDIQRNNAPSAIADDVAVVAAASDKIIASGTVTSVDDPAGFFAALRNVETFCAAEQK
jgi:hypothetical protein